MAIRVKAAPFFTFATEFFEVKVHFRLKWLAIIGLNPKKVHKSFIKGS